MRYFIYLLMLVSLTACSSDQPAQVDSSEKNPTIIVTYAVAPGTENQMESVINSLLVVGGDGDRIGRARVLPNRMVVVSAPAAVHTGIAALIEKMNDVPSESSQRIRMHYWLVRGIPNSDSLVPDSLAEIAAALTDTSATAGAMHFEKLDYVQHSLRSGARATVSGGVLRGMVEAATVSGRLSLNLELAAPVTSSELRTEMDLESGETIVLAQMGSPMEDESGRNSVQLFVIRAEAF
jgi:hypothetical protein